MVDDRDTTIGVAVTTRRTENPVERATMRAVAGDDMALAAAHDDLVGHEISAATHQALVAVGQV